MWPPTISDATPFPMPMFPPPQTMSAPSQQSMPFPPLPLNVLLRCLAPTSGVDFPHLRQPSELPPCPTISLPTRTEPNMDFGFPYFLQPPKVFQLENELDSKQAQHQYGSADTSQSQKPKRLNKPARTGSDGVSIGSKKCKKISATTQSDTNEHIEDIRRFARAFKMKRLSLGLTQTQIGRALTAGDGPAYSQSAICRFEKLDITPKSAQRIKPVLERWLAELEGRRVGETPILPQSSSSTSGLGDGNSVCESVHSSPEDNTGANFGSGVMDGNGSSIYRMDCESDESCTGIRKRKSRTNFSADALDRLNHEFSINMHPSGTRISQLANQLNYDREVIRVWFCNKRQSFRNSGSSQAMIVSSRTSDQTAPWLPFQIPYDDEVPIDLSNKPISQ
ncbi:hypothetical protein ACTXT7_006394 [Hymenolepis weldensis]